MSTNTWFRVRQSGTGWTNAQGKYLIASLASGQTLVRTHLTWGFGGTTSTSISPTNIMANLLTFGYVTTVGNGSETPPHPVTHSGDGASVWLRWLYWSARAPTITAWDATGGTVGWASAPAEEPGDSKGQILAPGGMGVGNSLNLWATWAPFAAWDVSGAAQIWTAASVLVRTP